MYQLKRSYGCAGLLGGVHRKSRKGNESISVGVVCVHISVNYVWDSAVRALHKTVGLRCDAFAWLIPLEAISWWNSFHINGVPRSVMTVCGTP